MFRLSIRNAAELKPVALMRLTQIDDVDEILKDHNRDDIMIEEKLDGWKTQVIKSGGKVRIYSRRGEEKTDNFPELVEALNFLPNDTLVEGELVYWHNGKQDEGKVTSLAGSTPENSLEKAKELPGEIKIHLYDILWSRGTNVSDKPFSERRKMLQSIVKPGKKIEITKQYPFGNWEKAMNDAVKSGGEGIVLKVKDKPYEYKPSGQPEPKPKGLMYKYKGGVGKSDSDDYVVYDYIMSDKDKLKARFGQYYKGKLYHISEISNFSKEDEGKIKDKLKGGSFVIEIGFQERQPGGLRHQKFKRFRDDKKPKDATMHEFHVEHIDNFKEAKRDEANDFVLSKRASVADVINRDLEKMLGIKPTSRRRGQLPMEDFSGLKQVSPVIDVRKAYQIVCTLESKCGYAVGDSGTSFGATQVQFGSFLLGLARDEKTKEVTGVDPTKFRMLARSWSNIKKQMKGKSFWKRVPVDEERVRSYMSANPRSVLRRKEGASVRMNPGNKPGFVKIRNGKVLGYEIDTENLRSLGLDVDKNMPAIQKIASQYITPAVAHNAILRLFVQQSDPATYATFMNTFSRRHVNSNRELRNLADRISQRNFMHKINLVLKGVRESGYDTNAPGAYNIYQLVCIANGSGAGRVLQFLKQKKKFYAGNLHYLGRANPMIEKITGIPTSTPANGGMAGFVGKPSDTRIASFTLSKRADEYDEDQKEFEEMEDLEHTAINEGDEEFQDEPTVLEAPDTVYKFNNIYRGLQKELREDPDLREKIYEEFLEEKEIDRHDPMAEKYFEAYIEEYINRYLKGEFEKKEAMLLSKRASYSEPGVLYFPGQFAESIKNGDRRMTIRADDVPVNVEDVAKCMTYSGAHVCDLFITSKETMSTTRIKKAFGKRVAEELERKFGPDKRFVVIRFDVHSNANFADDEDDESKMSETLISKDGTSLTRGQIKSHYEKPEVRKKIMSRVKGDPVLIYLGVGKNKNVLKRNHNDKPIVITSDDPGKSDDPNNYFYWVKRRMLSIHQVFGTKTNLGFVDLDVHGGFSLDEAKKYAKELSKKIKSEFGSTPTVYQSGGSGLHVEFKLGEEKNIDTLRSDLKSMLDELNEDWDGVTTGVVKGKGMRSDISTLHNKGSIRVPGSFGETHGKVKKPLGGSQDDDDTYNNINYGKKYTGMEESLDKDPTSLDTGAIKSLPNLNVAPTDVGSYNVASKINKMRRNAAKRKRKILILISPDAQGKIPEDLFPEGFGVDVADDKDIKNIKAANYDSFFVVGGENINYKSKDAQKLLKTFVRQKKPVAMVSHAPLLAADAGLLIGREITGCPEIIGRVRRSKGIWTGMPVERDGLLFTAADDVESLAWAVSNYILDNQISSNIRLNDKEANTRLNAIWKFADEAESELDRLMREQQEEMEGSGEIKTIEEEMEEARRAPDFDPKKLEPEGKKVKEIKLEPKEKPKLREEPKEEPKKKFQPPKKSLTTQIEGDVPELVKKKKKPEIEFDFEDLDEFGGDEEDSLGKEEATERLDKMLEELGERYLNALKAMDDDELKKHIVFPGEEDEEGAEREYDIMINYTMSIGETPDANWDQFKEYKELTLEEGEDDEFEEEISESAVTVDGKEKSSAIPIFMSQKLDPPTSKSGDVIDHWPKVKIPEMSKKASQLFLSEDINSGPGLRKIFNNVDAWSVLKKEPQLLKTWILPAIIMAVGYRFFEINSIQQKMGQRSMRGKGIQFKHLAGGAPFGMLDDIDESTAKRMMKGEISVEDLPQAKRYIQEIVKLVTEYTNVYFSKDYADPVEGREKPIPIDSYIYSALKYEMTRKIADAHDYKEQRAPVCAVCKAKFSKNKAIEKMEQVSRGIFKCPTCERTAQALVDNDLKQIEEDVRVADGYLSKLDEKLSVLKSRIESTEDSDKKRELEERRLYLEEEIDKYRLQRSGLLPRKREVQKKINIYKAQSIVPRWHTWCPNERCPGKRIPLNSVDWDDEVWNTGEGKVLKKKLKETYGIVPLGEVEQDAEEMHERHKISEALSWIKKVPFICPHDGVKFKMGEVEGQGAQGRAGFFWDPYSRLVWVPKGKMERGTYEELEQSGIGTNEAREQLDTYQHFSSIAQQLARKQYYDFFNRLRARTIDERAGKTKPLPKARRVAQHRNLYLYDTVKDFSFEDPVSYVAWMSGSLVYSQPVIDEDGKSVTNQNVIQQTLPYERREDMIYQPILQRWIDRMLREGTKEFEGKKKDPFAIFNLQDWFVNENTDGIPSDGPGTYFIAKVEGEVNVNEDNVHPYGFKCVIESKRKLSERQRSKEWDKRGPRLARVLDLWKLTKKDVEMLSERQKEGKDPIPKVMAESIIDRTKKESLHGDLSYHDYHDVALDRKNTTLIPGNYVLVRALIMPGRSEWGPLRYIRHLEKNKEGFEFWDKFYELTVLQKDNPEYWKEFSEKMKTAKDYLHRAEMLIDRELARAKKKAGFSISIRAEKDPLSTYKKKRKFNETPEPEGKAESKNKHRYVIQRHKAERAGEHFDLRLENDDGAMSSWAIPKHKLPKGKEKLLAMKTEDHPISYNKFEGEIPKGEYGAGKVTIHDSGTYEEIESSSSKIVFKLKGKEKGTYKLFKTDGNKWMIMEHKEEDADFPLSVRSHY